MSTVILTCRQHLHLRWVCQAESFTERDGYTAGGQLKFIGTIVRMPTSRAQARPIPAGWHQAPSVDGEDPAYEHRHSECTCSSDELTRAPEDRLLRS